MARGKRVTVTLTHHEAEQLMSLIARHENDPDYVVNHGMRHVNAISRVYSKVWDAIHGRKDNAR